MKIKYNEKEKVWEELEPYSEEGIYIAPKLMEKIENIVKIKKKGWDFIGIIDGARRSGKSTLGLTIGKILQPNLTIQNVAYGAKDAAEKIKNLPDGSFLQIDEGSLVFNSKEALKKEQIRLMKIIDVCGQKNLTLFIVLPSFFDIARVIAVTHSRFLLHVYPDEKLNRGRFAYFGEDKKKFLYEYGKKHYGSYAKPRADFTSEFVNYNPLGNEYLELKKKSLMEALEFEEAEEKPQVAKQRMQRDVLVYYVYKNKILDQLQIEALLKKHDVGINQNTISRICQGMEVLSLSK